MGLAVSTRFNTFCTAVHATVTALTAFCAAAKASAAPLFLINAIVDTANALTLSYIVTVSVFIPATKVETAANA